MSGFVATGPRTALRPSRPAGAAGPTMAGGRTALALPDLDEDAGTRRRAEAAAREAASDVAARAAALAAARAEGHAEGEAAGRAEAAAAHAAARETAEARAIEAAAAALAAIAPQAEAAVGAAALAVARLLLAALDAALPAAAARLGPDSAAGLVETLRPVLEQAGQLRLFVAPGFGAATAARIGDARVTVQEEAALAPGDARAAWRDGEALAALADRRAAIAALLDSLGLGPPPAAEAPT